MSIEENAKNISMAQVACFVGEEFTREALKQVSFYSAMSGIMKGLNMRSDRIEQLESQLVSHEATISFLKDTLKEIADESGEV